METKITKLNLCDFSQRQLKKSPFSVEGKVTC